MDVLGTDRHVRVVVGEGVADGREADERRTDDAGDPWGAGPGRDGARQIVAPLAHQGGGPQQDCGPAAGGPPAPAPLPLFTTIAELSAAVASIDAIRAGFEVTSLQEYAITRAAALLPQAAL